MFQVTRFQVQVLKPCKSVKETSDEALFIKVRQLTQQLAFIEVRKADETRNSTANSIDRLSIEIYENQIFSFDFIPIHEYVFEFSFLTTLNIYKDCFKGRYRLHSCPNSCKLWSGTKFALVNLSLEEAAVFVHRRVL